MSNNQIQYTGSGSYHIAVLSSNQVPSHTHGSLPSMHTYNNEPSFSCIHFIGDDGLSYTIDLQDIVKKLRLDRDTNVKRKKCYE